MGIVCSSCYNSNCPTSCGEFLARTLEMKRGLIKCNVLKFCDNYHVVHALNKNGSFNEDVLKKQLDLYKSMHPKKTFFMFIHCWMFFKNTS